MKHRIAALTVVVSLAQSGPAAARLAVNKLGDTVVDERALTVDGAFGQAINGKSFQQDMVVSHRGWQYLGYYDAARRVAIARRRHSEPRWEIARFADYDFTSDDSHNTISIAVCPGDGTIHLAWDHHADPLNYRVSRAGVATDPEAAPWGPDLFGPVLDRLEAATLKRLTYPRFLRSPGGGIQFFYRIGGSGNGDRYVVDYDPARGVWSATRQIDSGRSGAYEDRFGRSTTRCSYPNGYHYGPRGKLHATWVWREDAGGANHDLVYAYSPDRGRSWRNSDGAAITAPVRVDTPGATVVEIARSMGLVNTHGQAIDADGRIHVVMRHCTEESLAAVGSEPGQSRWGPKSAWRYVHYWREIDGGWRRATLPVRPGSRPKLAACPSGDLLLVYGAVGDHSGEATPRPLGGDLVIAGATREANWADWRVLHTEPGPFMNEMLIDPTRWELGGTLAIPVQESPSRPREPTRLRVLEFCVQGASETRERVEVR